jgi:hypothetical protein
MPKRAPGATAWSSPAGEVLADGLAAGFVAAATGA